MVTIEIAAPDCSPTVVDAVTGWASSWPGDAPVSVQIMSGSERPDGPVMAWPTGVEESLASMEALISLLEEHAESWRVTVRTPGALPSGDAEPPIPRWIELAAGAYVSARRALRRLSP